VLLGVNFYRVIMHHVAKLGGNANNGSNAGLFYWNLNNDSLNDNVNIGSQVCLF